MFVVELFLKLKIFLSCMCKFFIFLLICFIDCNLCFFFLLFGLLIVFVVLLIKIIGWCLVFWKWCKIMNGIK